MKNTKIDWCDATINPVIGCKNGCTYCYARKINDRFHFIDKWDEPQFFEERLKQLDSKKPKSIFMDSMSDIGWWEPEWGTKVYDAIKRNPQHNYIFLTKGNTVFCDYEKNIFNGTSITSQNMADKIYWNVHFDFYSIEPLLEPIKLSLHKNNKNLKQIIIGAETGNRKGKVIPKKEWVKEIVDFADKNNIKIFMKESLRNIMGDDFRQDKLIWDVNKEK